MQLLYVLDGKPLPTAPAKGSVQPPAGAQLRLLIPTPPMLPRTHSQLQHTTTSSTSPTGASLRKGILAAYCSVDSAHPSNKAMRSMHSLASQQQPQQRSSSMQRNSSFDADQLRRILEHDGEDVNEDGEEDDDLRQSFNSGDAPCECVNAHLLPGTPCVIIACMPVFGRVFGVQ